MPSSYSEKMLWGRGWIETLFPNPKPGPQFSNFPSKVSNLNIPINHPNNILSCGLETDANVLLSKPAVNAVSKDILKTVISTVMKTSSQDDHQLKKLKEREDFKENDKTC